MIMNFDGDLFRSMIISASGGVTSHMTEINDLNVFPVPDGDTGSNMNNTLSMAADAMEALSGVSLGECAERSAAAMLRGARGNSGVILSLLFRGIAGALKDAESCDGALWAEAMEAGVKSAYGAVDKPAEGTILTVTKDCAEAASSAASVNNEVLYVMEESLKAAEVSLANTVEQNPVLKKAGVVDAGARGWNVVLESMISALKGEPVKRIPVSEAVSSKGADFSEFESEDIKFGFCTEFIVLRDRSSDPAPLKSFLAGMGDSLVFVSDDELIKVHVHTNEPLTVLGEALKYGVFDTVKVENMKRQHTMKLMSSEQGAVNEEAEPAELKKSGIVAVCSGDGFTEEFKRLGADEVVSGGQTMNPSTEDLQKAVEKVNAETVFIFPNNKNIIMAANQVKSLTEKNVIVIPTRTVPQGMAAMQMYDLEGSDEDNEETMNDAFSDVTTIQVTFAARDSKLGDMDIKKGQFLGLYDDQLIASGDVLRDVLTVLADRLKENEKSFITIYKGEDADEEQTALAEEIFGAAAEEIDGEVFTEYGGQPLYSFIIAAE